MSTQKEQIKQISNKEFIRYHLIFVNQYGARLIDADLITLQNFLLKVRPEDREGLRLALNTKRERIGLMPIYADLL